MSQYFYLAQKFKHIIICSLAVLYVHNCQLPLRCYMVLLKLTSFFVDACRPTSKQLEEALIHVARGLDPDVPTPIVDIQGKVLELQSMLQVTH